MNVALSSAIFARMQVSVAFLIQNNGLSMEIDVGTMAFAFDRSATWRDEPLGLLADPVSINLY